VIAIMIIRKEAPFMPCIRPVIWALAAVAIAMTTGCGAGSDSGTRATGPGDPGSQPGLGGAPPVTTNDPIVINGEPYTTRTAPYPEVLISTSAGDIKLRLNAEKSRMAVENFLENYVDHGFYDGTIFHHVEQGFIIIGGGYTADGQAKETRTPIHNEAHNGLRNRRGTIAMTRDAQYADSATSQFFINLVDNPSLDYAETAEKTNAGYCVFGEVVVGMDVVDRIAQVAVKPSGAFPLLPVEPVTVLSVKRL
jgi:cyclophilin family peptidyl-prolyl cis-trans isomerase